MPAMRTTIDLPDPLFHRAKLAAVQRRLSLKRLIADALEAALAEVPAASRRMTAPPIRLGLAEPVPALSNLSAAAMMDEEELAKLRPA
jgi:hypothetical protein